MLYFDEYEFEKVADVLVRMNKSLADNQNVKTKEELISFMKSMANHYLYDCVTIFSTGGFVLTAFVDSSGKRMIRASVSGYMVDCYVKAIEDRVQKLLDPV